MKTKNDPRHQSRIIALQKLFEQEYNSNQPFKVSDLKTINEGGNSHNRLVIDEEFYKDIVDGVKKNSSKLDNMIRKYTLKRPFAETSRIDLLILRMAIYEIRFSENKTPTKVVIDEAIELAKEFGGNKSFTFINGVLGNIIKNNENA